MGGPPVTCHLPQGLHAFRAIGIFFALVALTANPATAQFIVDDDFTQNGGTFTISPAAPLWITNGVSDPLLTLTNGATTSGVQAAIIGRGTGEQGSLIIEQASQLNSSGLSTIGAQEGSFGAATVTGTGSAWINNGNLYVGGVGAARLIISNGGLVRNAEGTVGRGNAVPTLTIATVTGTASRWENNGPLYVGYGGDGILDVDGGGVVTSNSGYVGFFSARNGATATITGSGSQWNITNELLINRGTLNILNNGYVSSATGNLGISNGNTATVNVTDSGSQWSVSGALRISTEINNSSTLNITNGGLVTSESGVVGNMSRTDGFANVSGAGARWEMSSQLEVGYFGDGTLAISAGGFVSNHHGVVGIGYADEYGVGSGTAVVTGTGSHWLNRGILTVGADTNLPTTGTLSIEDGGLVEANIALRIRETGTVSGNQGTILGDVEVLGGLLAPGTDDAAIGLLTIDGNLSQSNFARLAFELADPSSFDQLLVTGLANLAGMIDIDLIAGFDPTPGASFKLVDFGSFLDSGFVFDFSGAPLSHPDWSWDTSSFTVDGTIRVVPEPSTIVLAATIGLALLGLRRRTLQ